MAESLGLRELKKQRTRQALVAAALRLFAEKGYERTTVAEIAAAADVSTKTLFNYFSSKEEMVFAEHRRRMEVVLTTIAERGREERLTELLSRMADELLATVQSEDTTWGPVRLGLVTTVPELQAWALRLLFAIQQQWAHALHLAYPDQLDRVTAAGVVGALVGAIQGSAVASLDRGDPPENVPMVVRSAVDLALRGIGSLDEKRAP